MKAIILAAGEGVRMRPLTNETPKPLLTICGKPLIRRLVEGFPPEIDELIIVVGYLKEKIKEYCGEEFLGRKVIYVEQESPRGTYFAITLCYPHLYGSPEKRFFVFYADDLIGGESIKEAMKHKRALIVKEIEDPRQFGVVTLNDDGSVKELIEKPENPISNLALTNGMMIDDRIFQYPPPQVVKGEYYLSTAIAEMAKHHKITTVKADFWFPIATPEHLKKAEELLNCR